MIITSLILVMMTTPVLVVKDLTVCRGCHCVVERVSFEVMPGSNTAIIGPNGAGKSTLVQALLGILPRQQGEVTLLGHTLSPQGYLPPSVRQSVAYLPQSFQFDRGIPMTVAEFVGLGWGRLGWPWQGRAQRRQAVTEALARVQGEHLGQRSLSQLSGGETKRVLLAYCLVWPRHLLILDEAPEGLDAPGEGEFYRLLADLQQSLGWAILQVSHDLERVNRHCDHVICLHRTLLCQGSPAHTLTPEHLAQVHGWPASSLWVHPPV